MTDRPPRWYFDHTLYQVDDDVVIPLCPDCGALVGDTFQHDEWHEQQKAVAAEDTDEQR